MTNRPMVEQRITLYVMILVAVLVEVFAIAMPGSQWPMIVLAGTLASWATFWLLVGEEED